MVKPTDLWNLNNLARPVRLNYATFWCVLIQGQVRLALVIITKITFQNTTQVPLVDHDHMVQTFSANTSDHPFRIAVLPRTPDRYRNLSDTQSIDSRREIMTIDPVTISYQVPRHGVVGKCFHRLLCRPST